MKLLKDRGLPLLAGAIIIAAAAYFFKPLEGRYSFHAGAYEELNATLGDKLNGETTKRPGIFKIDAVTGKVWIYHATTLTTIDEVRQMNGWEEMKNETNVTRLRRN
jgi:hypothetical protein